MGTATAYQKRRRGMALLAALLTFSGGLAGCGGGSSISTPGGPAGWLSSIPDTAAYRSQIVVNNLRTAWTSAGVSFPLPASQVGAAEAAVFRQIGAGSQLGTYLLVTPYSRTIDFLGYDARAVSFELSAGSPGSQLSLVLGTIDASKVRAAISRLGVLPVSTGGIDKYTIPNALQLPGNVAPEALAGIHTIATPDRGGRAAAGSPKAPSADVIHLLRGSHVAKSLASDPVVHQMLRLLAGSDIMLFGTSLVVSPERLLGGDATPAQLEAISRQLGLSRLPAAPLSAGYGYLPGNPTHPTVVSVALYPHANDARAAAGILGNVLRSGNSLMRNQAYARLLTVDGINVRGDAVIARLTEKSEGIVADSVQQDDWPLFWAPVPAS